LDYRTNTFLINQWASTKEIIMITIQKQIEKIQTRVDEGYYDSLGGQRPFAVFVDNDGDICVAYRASGDRGSIPWETKVA
jgi:hypothetical protein